jgi:hypothetical protein
MGLPATDGERLMALKLFTIEEKLAVIHAEIAEQRQSVRRPGSAAQRHYEILKSIAADLQARLELPRNNALGELNRAMERMVQSKDTFGYYDVERMAQVATVVISKWPIICQALENFGEESAE